MSNHYVEKEPEVVVVEDEEDLADLYAHWLDDQYDVSTAHTGEDALETITPSTDIILLDRRLPGISGDEVLGEIRDRGIECPVAMVSAVDPEPEILKLDIDDYLVKAVTKDEIQSTVQELLRRSELNDQLREYLTVVSKKETLETEHPIGELRQNEEYEGVSTQLRQLRNDLTNTLAEQGRLETKPSEQYSRRQTVWTGLAIFVPALVLIGIHFFFADPVAVLFERGTPQSSLLVSYLSSFVHTSDAHLYSNVGTYLLVAILTYELSLRLLAARWFYVTSGLLLTLLPVLTAVVLYSVVELVYANRQIQFIGFSHIVSGFVAFSFVVFVTLLRLLYSSRSVFLAGGYILLQAATVILYISNSEGITLVGGLCLLAFGAFAGERIRAYRNGEESGQRVLENTSVIIMVSWLYTIAGLGLVPTTELATELNILSHLLGVAIGFLITLATALLLNVYPIRNEIEREGYALPDSIL